MKNNHQTANNTTARQNQADQQQDQFSKFFLISSDIIAIIDATGAIKRINPATFQLLGYTQVDLISKPFIDFVHPDDRQLTLDEITRQANSGSAMIFENRILCKNGSLRWMAWRADHDPNQGLTYATARDITRDKQNELTMFHSSQYNRSLIEASPDALATIGPDGHITDVNTATERVTGCSRLELIGTDFSNYFSEPERAQAGYQQVFREGLVRDYPLEIRHRNGSLTFVLYNAAIYRDAEHNVLGVFAAARDVTELKRAEQALRNAYEYNRSLIEASPDPLVTIGPNGTITDVNRATERVTGYPRAELINTDFSSYFSDPGLAQAGYQQVFREGFVRDYPLEICHRNGLVTPVLYNASIYRDADGREIGVFAAARDITKLKQAEQELIMAHAQLEQRVRERTAELLTANLSLEKAARLKDEFLAAISHELRTPLTGILGLSDILLEMPAYGPITPKQSNAIQNIRNSGRLLLQTINDLLDLSKIGAGKLGLKFGPITLQNICQLSLQAIANQAQNKNIQTSFSIVPESIILMADEDRLKQILQNLLNNALKFTKEGGKIGIEVLGDPQNKEVNITVWDTGIGIQPEDLPRLFQPFVQLDARLARQYNGAGMGLVLVKQLVTLHAGRVSVESVPDQGSRFTVSLPWKPQMNKKERPAPQERRKKKNEWRF